MKERTIFNELYYLVNKHYFDYIENERDIDDYNKNNNLIKKCSLDFLQTFGENIDNNIFILSYIIDYFNLKTKLFINTPRPQDFDDLKIQFSRMLILYKNAA